tara:strand:- start:72 stop:386 length:315 start_codon:yes stop_codon:yes gene_type:complete
MNNRLQIGTKKELSYTRRALQFANPTNLEREKAMLNHLAQARDEANAEYDQTMAMAALEALELLFVQASPGTEIPATNIAALLHFVHRPVRDAFLYVTGAANDR